uniref:Uncharacterized protein n=1 Tax=Rhizophora mucronata TaxID=61149 RepID=A0A2P2PC29_RHIMU
MRTKLNLSVKLVKLKT